MYLNLPHFFGGATDSIKAASIAALVTVFTFVIGRYFEHGREIKSKVNIEKIEVYKKFFDIYFGLFVTQKFASENDSDENTLAIELMDFQKELIFWGSDRVIKEYLVWKDILAKGAKTHQASDEDRNKYLILQMTAVAKLLKAMRQDIGYSFTTFSTKDLMMIQLAQDDPEIKKMLGDI